MMNNPALAAELGFTEEQVKKLKTALGDLSKKEIDLRAELDKGGIDQAKLMSETTLDEKAILAAVEKAGAIRTRSGQAEDPAVAADSQEPDARADGEDQER